MQARSDWLPVSQGPIWFESVIGFRASELDSMCGDEKGTTPYVSASREPGLLETDFVSAEPGQEVRFASAEPDSSQSSAFQSRRPCMRRACPAFDHAANHTVHVYHPV
jgi:hypothetical protein